MVQQPAKVFISYAHEDHDWLTIIQRYLRVLEINNEVRLKVWDDTKLAAGSDWKATIDAELEGASIAILIVTINFLNSEFIVKEELPYLLARKESQRLRIMPILARPCPYQMLPDLAALQFTTVHGQALSAVAEHEWETVLGALVTELRAFVGVSGKTTPPPPPPPSPQPSHQLQQRLMLEASLRQRSGEEIRVELRYNDLEDSRQNRTLTYNTRIRLSNLVRSRDNVEEYSRMLDRQLFPEGAPRTILDLYKQHLGQVGTRLRVNVESTARDLQRVFWETLPLVYTAERPAAASTQLFVRSVSAAGEDWPSPTLSTWPDFQVVLCPLGSTGGVELSGPMADCAAAFTGKSLSCNVPQEPMDLEDLEGINAKVLLLALQIDRRDSEPVALVKDREGGTRVYNSEEFARLIRGFPDCPQLIILDAWSGGGESESAGSVEEALVIFASELITTGVCAVVTRQAPMERSLWLKFLAEFASELRQKGSIDSASSAARLTLEQAESWKPIVLTRLRSGQLWYRPMFQSHTTTAWDLLIGRIRSGGTCVPIIGPQISRRVMRSREEISERWARKYHYPGATSERHELRKVAQYVATMEEPRVVREGYREAVIEYIAERFSDAMTDLGDGRSIAQVLKASWDKGYSRNSDDPFNLLAKLELPVYFTTNLHNYLSLAIAGLHRTPSDPQADQAVSTPRDRIFTEQDAIHGEEQDKDERAFALDRKRPLIYHLFGRLDRLDTMVLTEDDHFRFLLQFHGKWTRLPSLVRSHFSDSALIFLGFDLGKWEFRTVFRALLEIAGIESIRKNTHVAVQISMDDDTITDPERTHQYLVQYFNQISIRPHVFLGSAQDFLIQLDAALKAASKSQEDS